MDAGCLKFDLAYTAPELAQRLSELYSLELCAVSVGRGRVLVAAGENDA
jgi:hypothetical protein